VTGQKKQLAADYADYTDSEKRSKRETGNRKQETENSKRETVNSKQLMANSHRK
jgi:hypothetical protein